MEVELITSIPKDRLILVICDFYWNKGYKTIELLDRYNVHLASQKEQPYNPSKQIRDIDKYNIINVSTNKKNENKQVFDSVDIVLEETVFGTKINWSLGYGFKIWHLIYALVALIAVFIYGIGFFTGLIITAILCIPILYLVHYREKKADSNPNVAEYKKEFEDFICDLEKELIAEE